MARPPAPRPTAPFWESKPLDELDAAEWEALCDGCGKCCLHKLEDVDTGELHFTNVACRMLDRDACRCADYPNRATHVPDCVRLTPTAVLEVDWLPGTCAYLLRARGEPLPPWHPLVAGDAEAIHRAGRSVRGWTISETETDGDDLWGHLVDPERIHGGG